MNITASLMVSFSLDRVEVGTAKIGRQSALTDGATLTSKMMKARLSRQQDFEKDGAIFFHFLHLPAATHLSQIACLAARSSSWALRTASGVVSAPMALTIAVARASVSISGVLRTL